MKNTSTYFKNSLFTALFGLFATAISAQGINCDNAALISVNGTYNADGPAGGNGCENCSGSTHADWYFFTAPKNGEITVSACGRGLGATDSRLFIYAGDCSNLTEVAANDDACGLLGGYAAAVEDLTVEGGLTYYFEWDNRWSDDGFEFDFTYTPDCNNPTNVEFSEVTNKSFKVNWESDNPGANFTLEYGELGFIPGNGTEIDGIVGQDMPVLVNGLDPGTTYSVYTQEECGLGTETDNVGPFNQTTNFAAPPENDFCADATAIVCDQTYSGSIVNATETDNPEGTCGTSSQTPGVWFGFIGNGDRITLSLCASNYNTKLMVYEGNCNALTCVAGNNNSADCTFNRSKLSFNTSTGTNYFVFVTGSNGVTGNYVLEVSCEDACQEPVNDNCANATTLAVSEQGTCNAIMGSNECADLATQANDCEQTLGIADVWYTFNTGDVNAVVLDVDLNTADNMKYAVYDACNANQALTCGTLNPITAELITSLAKNTDYLLQLWNGGGIEAGSFEVCLSEPIGSGVEDQESNVLEANIFPNPVSDQLTIAGEGTMELTILNVSGQVVYTGKVVQEGKLDVSGFEAGVYFVKLKSDQLSSQLQFVKQ